MSWKVTALVRSRKAGSPVRKALLLVLADVANHDGSSVFLSTQSMANETEVSQRTIKRQLKQLEEDRLISRVGKRPCLGGYTVNYSINLKAIEALPESGDILSNTKSEAVTHTTKVVTEDAQKPAPSVTQTILEQSSLNYISTDELFSNVWKQYPSSDFSKREASKREFEKLSETDKRSAVDSLRPYKTSLDETPGQFPLSLQRYLVERVFEKHQPTKGVIRAQAPMQGTAERKLFDLVTANRGTGVWTSWFINGCDRIADGIIYPRSALAHSRLSNDYLPAIEASGFTLAQFGGLHD